MYADSRLPDFLREQRRAGLALAAESDLFELHPLDPQRFAVVFHCTTLVRDARGAPREHVGCCVGIRFTERHLIEVDPAQVLTWIAPDHAYHPNIRVPFLCIGWIAPGTPLVELIYRVHELIVFDNVLPVEQKSLNREACAWARRNQGLFPLDRRPLKWRSTR